MTYEWWPLFDLRLAGPRLTMRPMRESDLDLMAAELPEDLELDPAATRFDQVGDRVWRGIVRHQEYWKAYGSWRPQAWRLNFVVSLGSLGTGGAGSGGPVIGVQELEGVDNFLVVRTVDTSSYLNKSARGHGYGKEMRRAVLALAFGPLQAEAAITSAWHDNGASLGVSRALGYQPNGEQLHEREFPEASPAAGAGLPGAGLPGAAGHGPGVGGLGVAGLEARLPDADARADADAEARADAGACASVGARAGVGADAGAMAGARAKPFADVMVHLRMRREEWLASGQGADIDITGFDACRPLFGLPPS